MPDRLACHTAKTVQKIHNDELAVHKWVPAEPRFVVLYVHGLQSHAGWSWELAMDVAARGGEFHVLDRFGSGISSGPHDAFPDPQRTISDYLDFMTASVEASPGLPIIAVGHCLGGSVLTATLAQHPELAARIDAVCIVSSWLARMHDNLAPFELRSVREDISGEIWDVGLRPEDFSGNASYQEFIRTDPLAVRGIQRSTRKHMLALEDIYIGDDVVIRTPSKFIASFEDPLLDIPRAVSSFQQTYNSSGSVHLLASDKHYLPFTSARTGLVDQIVVESAGKGF